MSEPLGHFADGPTGAPLAGEAAREPEDKEHMKQTVSVADKELERLLAEAYK